MQNSPDLENQLEDALQAQADGRYDEALATLQKLVDLDYPPAIGNLGCMYQLGLGVESNGSKAVELLKKAVELGFGPAAHNLGTIYGAGMPGIEPNTEISRFYREKAREMGADYIKPKNE